MKQYNMNTIIRNLNSSDTTADWGKMYNLALDVVAESARGQRKVRIMNALPSLVKPCGILDRLKVDDLEDGGYLAYYIAGQYYPGEMATIRDIFDPRKR